MATILSATELANELGTTPREVRKYLRSVTPKDEQPGKGARWGVKKATLRTHRKGYADWAAAREATPESTDEEGVVPEADEPTAEELDAIDAEG